MVYFKRAEFWHRTPSDDKLTEPLREVAEYLKVKDRTIYRVVAKREIPGFEVGGSWRFRCLRCLLLVMCTHPLAKEALTLHLARSEGYERYFGCN